MAFKHPAELTLRILSRLSLRRLNQLADSLAAIIGSTPNQLSRMTRANLCLCFSSLDKTARKALYQQSLRHTCRSFVELAAVWCWPVKRLMNECEAIRISPAFTESTRGKIIIAPHLGSWEALSLWLAEQGPTISLYKARKKQPLLNGFMLDARGRSGATLVSTKAGGLRKLLRGLQSGQSLMVLPDQRPSRRKARTKSVFFGFEAETSTLVQALANRQPCDIFIAAAIRNPEGTGFHIYLDHLDSELISAEPEPSANYMNQCIEAWIREFPGQYQWAYRRFTTNTYKKHNCL